MLCLAVDEELKLGKVGSSLQRAEQALQTPLWDVIWHGVGKIEAVGLWAIIQSPGCRSLATGGASLLLHHLKAEDVAGSKASCHQ